MSKDKKDGLVWFDSAETAAFSHVKVRFALPEKPTVRQQLAFQAGQFSQLAEGGYMQNFAGALAVMTGWECAALPDPHALDIDKETSKAITDIVVFVAARTHGHFESLESVPKN